MIPTNQPIGSILANGWYLAEQGKAPVAPPKKPDKPVYTPPLFNFKPPQQLQDQIAAYRNMPQFQPMGALNYQPRQPFMGGALMPRFNTDLLRKMYG